VVALARDGDRVTGVHLDDGTTLLAQTVVIAAGCWSAQLLPLPVRPVKGQILRLHTATPFVGATVRALVQGTSVYVVPRADGEVVVGATMEEQGYDVTVTAGGVYELLRDAHTVLPGITELTLVETLAGLRPGTPDNAPLVGPSALDGCVLATGHGRNGILLAPLTASAVAQLVMSGAVSNELAPFAPARFHPERLDGVPA
jgi:glycine oxidase